MGPWNFTRLICARFVSGGFQHGVAVLAVSHRFFLIFLHWASCMFRVRSRRFFSLDLLPPGVPFVPEHISLALSAFSQERSLSTRELLTLIHNSSYTVSEGNFQSSCITWSETMHLLTILTLIVLKHGVTILGTLRMDPLCLTEQQIKKRANQQTGIGRKQTE